MDNNHNQYTIQQAINGMLKAYHIDEKLNQVRLISSWEKVMGKSVSNRTTSLRIKNKILFVQLTSAPLREELHYAKDKIIQLLNEEVGEKVIEDVVLK